MGYCIKTAQGPSPDTRHQVKYRICAQQWMLRTLRSAVSPDFNSTQGATYRITIIGTSASNSCLLRWTIHWEQRLKNAMHIQQ